MPKKSPAKTASKTSRSKKNAKPRSTRSSAAKKTDSMLTKPLLHKEQMDFHKKHPNAQALLTLFVLLAIIALALCFYRYGWQPANGYGGY